MLRGVGEPKEKPLADFPQAAFRWTVWIDPWLWPLPERRRHSDFPRKNPKQSRIYFL